MMVIVAASAWRLFVLGVEGKKKEAFEILAASPVRGEVGRFNEKQINVNKIDFIESDGTILNVGWKLG